MCSDCELDESDDMMISHISDDDQIMEYQMIIDLTIENFWAITQNKLETLSNLNGLRHFEDLLHKLQGVKK